MERIEMTSKISEKYNDYFSKMLTVRINREVKDKIVKELKKKGGKWQDFLDDLLRDYCKKNGIEVKTPKIRKVEFIE